jgi:hypothetical protein
MSQLTSTRPHGTTARRVGLALSALALIGGCSLGIGVLAGLNVNIFAALAATGLMTSVCLIGPKSRLLVSIVGGLIVFQSDLEILKLGYLVVALLCFAMSVGSVRGPTGGIRPEFRSLVITSFALFCYLLFTFFLSRSIGTSTDQWLRDSLSYFLLTLLPYIGIAAGPAISARWNRRMYFIVGVVVSLGVAADWLGRRGVSALPIGRFVLSSAVVVALCFSFAVTMACLPSTRRRLLWGAASLLIMMAMLLPGTRTNLLLFATFFGILGSVGNVRVPAGAAARFALTLIVTLVIAIPIFAQVFISDPEFLRQRVAFAVTVLQGDAEADQSYGERKAAYDLADEALGEYPTFGTGPGHLYAIYPIPTYNLDSPVIIPAKFGLVGMIFIGAFLLSIVDAVRKIRRRCGPSPTYTALSGWLVILVALVPFGPWLEDKGFSIALVMIFASMLSQASRIVARPIIPKPRSVSELNAALAPRSS